MNVYATAGYSSLQAAYQTMAAGSTTQAEQTNDTTGITLPVAPPPAAEASLGENATNAQSSGSGAQAQSLFQALVTNDDVNGDGELSLAEVEDTSAAALLADAISEYDANNNGALSSTEVGAAETAAPPAGGAPPTAAAESSSASTQSTLSTEEAAFDLDDDGVLSAVEQAAYDVSTRIAELEEAEASLANEPSAGGPPPGGPPPGGGPDGPNGSVSASQSMYESLFEVMTVSETAQSESDEAVINQQRNEQFTELLSQISGETAPV
ncbi:hypothetical protein BFP70_06740 [Thioclava sp. SK-1]|uniref:hypothetical protein n=1 Tax=Thioclava sp. SK-1 TaxID=1889770 RepID=UPI000825D848|nr:hypothetical protein [Thioclava sp. SK-1]OCX65832.1 hypothetical protein BFP70_06740 [Thioclava sp. SK-1]